MRITAIVCMYQGVVNNVKVFHHEDLARTYAIKWCNEMSDKAVLSAEATWEDVSDSNNGNDDVQALPFNCVVEGLSNKRSVLPSEGEPIQRGQLR